MGKKREKISFGINFLEADIFFQLFFAAFKNKAK